MILKNTCRLNTLHEKISILAEPKFCNELPAINRKIHLHAEGGFWANDEAFGIERPYF